MSKRNLKESIILSTIIAGSFAQANIPKASSISTYIIEDKLDNNILYSAKIKGHIDHSTLTSELNKLGLSITHSLTNSNLELPNSQDIKSTEPNSMEQMLKDVFGEKVIEVLPVDRIYLSGNDWGGTK